MPEELDAELGKHLAGYVECHTQLGSTLAQAKAEMEAAAKAAQEEARRKAAEVPMGLRPTECDEKHCPWQVIDSITTRACFSRERGKKATDKPAANTDSAPAPPPAPLPAATMTLFGGTQPAASASGEHSPTVTAAAAGGERTCKLAL
jgi:hypothetical protein